MGAVIIAFLRCYHGNAAPASVTTSWSSRFLLTSEAQLPERGKENSFLVVCVETSRAQVGKTLTLHREHGIMQLQTQKGALSCQKVRLVRGVLALFPDFSSRFQEYSVCICVGIFPVFIFLNKLQLESFINNSCSHSFTMDILRKQQGKVIYQVEWPLFILIIISAELNKCKAFA